MHDETPNSINNYVILAAKQYIWTNKFKVPNRNLSVPAFINILKYKIEGQKQAALLLNKLNDYDGWNVIQLLL